MDLFHRLRAEEICGYLFSFNPEPGTAMQDEPRAPIRRLRRIQLVKHLIETQGLPRSAAAFDAGGNLAGIRGRIEDLESAVRSGRPFMTNGCPDRAGEVACNRPYGSYRPGEEFRDYPFLPESGDVEVIRSELVLGEMLDHAEEV